MNNKNELPFFKLPSTSEKTMGPRIFWQRRNLLLLMLPDADSDYGRKLVEKLNETYHKCQKLEAEILVVVGGEKEKTEAMYRKLRSPFPFLFDVDRSVYSKIIGNEDRDQLWLMVVDRFGTIWSTNLASQRDDPGKLIKNAMESLDFINLQCPECGVHDMPVPTEL
jgi:peroxiredoxin